MHPGCIRLCYVALWSVAIFCDDCEVETIIILLWMNTYDYSFISLEPFNFNGEMMLHKINQ